MKKMKLIGSVGGYLSIDSFLSIVVLGWGRGSGK